jgi:hypothetical protein
MNDTDYREFLILLMCSDPWPVSDDGTNEMTLKNLADEEAMTRGFAGWIYAYHELS